MSQRLSARRLLVGSDHLHRMADDIERFLRILSGVVAEHAVGHLGPPVEFMVPVYQVGIIEAFVHLSAKRQGKPPEFSLVFRAQHGSIKNLSIQGLTPKHIVAFHRNLDAVLNAVLEQVPEIGDKLRSIADQAPPPIE